jgi:SAM-dependent methyltransferase
MEIAVSKVISPLDAMWRAFPNEEAYLAAGKTIADALRIVVSLSKLEPKSILDYGCGHGRVLRWLRAFWPTAQLSAADVRRIQIDFCAKTFDATPILIDRPFSEIQLPSNYDLIWLGSIFTHIDEEDWRGLILSLKPFVAKNGILCFSFAGRTVYELIKNGDKGGGLVNEPQANVVNLVSSYESGGFAFLRQAESNGRPWGRSIAQPQWVLNLCMELGGKIVLYSEQAYARRQDVVALRFE